MLYPSGRGSFSAQDDTLLQGFFKKTAADLKHRCLETSAILKRPAEVNASTAPLAFAVPSPKRLQVVAVRRVAASPYTQSCRFSEVPKELICIRIAMVLPWSSSTPVDAQNVAANLRVVRFIPSTGCYFRTTGFCSSTQGRLPQVLVLCFGPMKQVERGHTRMSFEGGASCRNFVTADFFAGIVRTAREALPRRGGLNLCQAGGGEKPWSHKNEWVQHLLAGGKPSSFSAVPKAHHSKDEAVHMPRRMFLTGVW